MTASADIAITLDFRTTQAAAARVRQRLLRLKRRFDLSAFEYCKQVRVAPVEIPHSHPKITLNTWVRGDEDLLATYLHEQLHWYATWFAHAHARAWRELMRALRARYPRAPVGQPDGGPDGFSTYLHLVVNWLEIETAGRFVGRRAVVRHVRALPYYRWIYAAVIRDRQALGGLFRAAGLLPVRPATAMSPEDLRLAARGN
jgi:hypothetical protein